MLIAFIILTLWYNSGKCAMRISRGKTGNTDPLCNTCQSSVVLIVYYVIIKYQDIYIYWYGRRRHRSERLRTLILIIVQLILYYNMYRCYNILIKTIISSSDAQSHIIIFFTMYITYAAIVVCRHVGTVYVNVFSTAKVKLLNNGHLGSPTFWQRFGSVRCSEEVYV